VGADDTSEAPSVDQGFETWVDTKEAQLGRNLRSDELYNELNKFDAQQVRLEARQLAATKADTGPYLGAYSPTGTNLGDVVAATGLAYAGGAFDPTEEDQPEPEDLAGVVDPEVTGATLFAENPALYSIGIENLNPNAPVEGYPLVPTTFAAQGGTVNYPRRIGQITGPGTGTSDSIPAMLSNGEFVMTKRAVDGAGGPGTMYDMMRNFEMRT
jgi:hypothetical protein